VVRERRGKNVQIVKVMIEEFGRVFWGGNNGQETIGGEKKKSKTRKGICTNPTHQHLQVGKCGMPERRGL